MLRQFYKIFSGWSKAKKTTGWWLSLPLRLFFACIILIPLALAIIATTAVTVIVTPILKFQQFIQTKLPHNESIFSEGKNQLRIH